MRITKVTTRQGDGGETQLGGGQKVFKHDLRIEAIGTVDELNCVLGLSLTEDLVQTLEAGLRRVQHELFVVGSDICLLPEDERRRLAPLLEEGHVAALESEIERFVRDLPPLREFVIPGGTRGAALLHMARTVCRRAERSAVALSREASVSPVVLKYLNRLGDWLFVAARVQSRAGGGDEPQWDRTISP